MTLLKSSLYTMKVVFKISPSYMIYCFCWSVFTALYRLILILAMPVVLDAILAGVAISTLIISLVGILSLSLLIDIIFSISESSYASKKEVVIKNALQREIYFKTIEIDIQRYDDPGFYNYRELAHELAAYVKKMGYTHVELMAKYDYLVFYIGVYFTI